MLVPQQSELQTQHQKIELLCFLIVIDQFRGQSRNVADQFVLILETEIVPSLGTGIFLYELTFGPNELAKRIQALSPKDDRQRSIQAQALSVLMGLTQTRWLMYEQESNSVSTPILVILVFWLTAIFISFGLFAPRNATVIAALFVAGMSVSGAIFLILEMYAPFGGIIQISSAPLRATLAQLGQ
jgi:hypothetical protein